MRNRIMGIMFLIVVLLLMRGIVHYDPHHGASESAVAASVFLSQEYLRGSMQGWSGTTLDLNGDGNEDLLVGAPYAQQNATMGALLVYLATPTGFAAHPSAVLAGDGNLGWSLVALGDVNGDGKADFAAGAYTGSGEDVSLSGTVAIYQGGGKPRKVAVLTGENAMDKFGYALAGGDVNGDGKADLIVGAPFCSPSPALYQQGAVYVYFGPGYNPADAVKIPASLANGGIGFSLAAGDINDDGVDDLLLGASGKVIGFYGARGSFSPSANPDVVFSSMDSGFGRNIAVLWDLNRDGFRDVAVGAHQAVIANVSETGRLFILKGGSGKRTVNADVGLSPDVLAKIDGEPNCGRFASEILPVADVDNDGIPELAVSAEHADGNPWPMTGKIFLFSGRTLTAGATVASARVIPGEARDMHLGAFLAVVGKGSRLAAGAPTENANTGRVRLFDLR